MEPDRAVELARGAPAIGALRAAAAIVRPADAIALVHRLPLADAQDSTDAVEPASSAVPAAAVPTHVLFRGRACVTARPVSSITAPMARSSMTSASAAGSR